MDNKKIAKKYIITVSILLVAFFAITLGLMLILRLGGSLFMPTIKETVLISLASAYIPCGAYTGFCVCFLRIKELKKNQMIFFVIFFPLILLFTIVLGNLLFIPTYIKELIIITKRHP